MKVKLIVAAVAIAAVSHAGLVNWGTTGTWSTDTFDGVTILDGWNVGLYTGTLGDINTADLEAGLVGSSSMKIQPSPLPGVIPDEFKVIIQELNLADSIPLFTVVFDNADKALAGNYLVVDAATFDSGTAQPPATAISYNVTDPVGTWQAIPEPATLGLMGMAGLGLFLDRKSVV